MLHLISLVSLLTLSPYLVSFIVMGVWFSGTMLAQVKSSLMSLIYFLILAPYLEIDMNPIVIR